MPAPEGVVAHVDDLRVPDHRQANLPSALLCSTVSRLDWVGSTSRLWRPIPFVLGFPMVPFAVFLDFFLKNGFQRTGHLVLCLRANGPHGQELLLQPSE